MTTAIVALIGLMFGLGIVMCLMMVGAKWEDGFNQAVDRFKKRRSFRSGE